MAVASFSNAELVARLKSRDRTAFSEFYDRYGKSVYNLCCRVMGSAQDAEDVTQDAFIKAYRQIGSLRDAEYLHTWLYRLAHNLCMDELRRRQSRARHVELDLDDADDPNLEARLPADTRAAARPERHLETREVARQVERAAQALPPNYRAALTLREIEGLSYGEIARALNLSVPAVETLLFRARAKFREQFLTQQLPPTRGECARYASYLSGWYDDALPPKRRERLAEHLAHCAHCRAALNELDTTARAYRALVPLAPPAALKLGLLAKFAGLTALAAPAAIGLSASTAIVSALVVVGVATGVIALNHSTPEPRSATPRSIAAAPTRTQTLTTAALASTPTPASTTTAPSAVTAAAGVTSTLDRGASVSPQPTTTAAREITRVGTRPRLIAREDDPAEIRRRFQQARENWQQQHARATLPRPTDHPILPRPTDRPILPRPTDHPTLPRPTDHPTLPRPTDHPTLPRPTDHPSPPPTPHREPTEERTPPRPDPDKTREPPEPKRTRVPRPKPGS